MKKRQVKPNTITDFQGYLSQLYSASNKNKSWDYIYGYLSRTINYLSKNIMNNKCEEVHFVRPISWLYALASKLDVNIEDAFVDRFPNMCPYCLKKPCICFRTGKLPFMKANEWETDKELYWAKSSIRNTKVVTTHDWAVDALDEIYPSNAVIWRFAGPWHQFAKMNEEVSELHEAISKHEVNKMKIDAVHQEFADSLARILVTWKMVYPNKSLNDSIINYYINGCPVCLKDICTCSDRSNRTAEVVDILVMQEIEDNLNKLKAYLPDRQGTIEDLRKNISAAKETQIEPQALHAAAETKSTLENIKKTVSNVDEVGQKSLSIIETTLRIISKLPFL